MQRDRGVRISLKKEKRKRKVYGEESASTRRLCFFYRASISNRGENNNKQARGNGCWLRATSRGTNIRAYANNDIHLHGTSASYAVRTMKKKFSPRRKAFFEEMEEIEGETRFRISIIIGSRCKCIATGNTRGGGVRPLAENRRISDGNGGMGKTGRKEGRKRPSSSTRVR